MNGLTDPISCAGSSASDAAMLLASKSNYQNILEGNHLPGVSYPDSLSTNLTQKRTSHKIAEQGRRNRINTALQEMQSLLPKSGPGRRTSATTTPASDGADTKDDDEGGGKGGQGNSKAATVESAIEYIRLLKKQAEERDRELEVKSREVERLRLRVEELEGRLGEGRSNGSRNGLVSGTMESTAEAKDSVEETAADTEMNEADSS